MNVLALQPSTQEKIMVDYDKKRLIERIAQLEEKLSDVEATLKRRYNRLVLDDKTLTTKEKEKFLNLIWERNE